MTAYLLNAIGFVLCCGALIWALLVLAEIVVDNHRRGMARVHRGTSWTKR